MLGLTYRSTSLSPVAEVGRRLGVLDPMWAFDVEGGPAPAGWWAPEQIGPELVDGWLSEQTRQLRSRRDVAAAYLGWGLEHALVSACVASWLVGPAVPDPSPGNVLLRVSDVGRVEAVRFRSDNSMPSTEEGAGRWLAERLVHTVGPLVETIRSLAGYRRTGLWGMVADSVAGTTVRLGQAAVLTPESACKVWDLAETFVQQLIDAGADIRRRPRLLAATPGVVGPLRMVRSTCCMYYATPQAVEGPPQERWCSTCPCTTQNRRT